MKSNFSTLDNKKNIEHIEKKQGISAFLDSTANLFLLMMKNHFKGSSLWIVNILIPIIVAFSMSILLPIWYSFMWVLFINLTLTAFMTYGGLFFTVRKSTIIKNISMTSSEEATLYVATFISILCTTLISLFISFLTILTTSYAGIASNQFFYNEKPEGEKFIKLSAIWWDMLFYYWFTATVVTFSISFVIEKVTSTQKNFFIISFVYLLAGLFFGGVMASNIGLIKGDPKVIASDNSEFLDNGQGVLPAYFWGKPAWIVSQFWPHYGLNQFAFHTLEAGSYSVKETGGPLVSKWADITMKDQLKDPRIIYYVVMPWAYSIFGYWTGGILVRYNMNKH